MPGLLRTASLRVSGGGGGGGATLGPELVVNGDFSSSVGWVLTMATISGGLLRLVGDDDLPGAMTEPAEQLTVGNYRYSFDVVTLTSGNIVTVRIGGTVTSVTVAAGNTYSGDIASGATAQLLILGSSQDIINVSIDNFSVKRVL